MEYTMNFFKTDTPPVGEPILVVIKLTSGNLEMFCCEVSDDYRGLHGELYFLDTGDPIGWSVEDITMWAPLAGLVEAVKRGEQ